MTNEEFIKLIETIGFKYYLNSTFKYKEFNIHLWGGTYNFSDGYEWIRFIPLNDLTPLENNFKKELRAIKLKELLR